MRDMTNIREIINNRLRELGARMSGIEAELDTPKSKDLGEQAIDLEDDEVLEGLGLAAESEARFLRLALERMEQGTYGVCTGCGEEISLARLEAVPYAMKCRDCARGDQ